MRKGEEHRYHPKACSLLSWANGTITTSSQIPPMFQYNLSERVMGSGSVQIIATNQESLPPATVVENGNPQLRYNHGHRHPNRPATTPASPLQHSCRRAAHAQPGM